MLNFDGQEFGHGEDKNTAAQMVAHALLGATLAYINGGDPTAGGSAAVASEAAAIYLTNQYKDKKEYQDENGVFQANLLSETEKAQIRDLTAGIGAVIGGAVGDSSYNAQLAGVIGQNAVENNQAGAHKFAKKQVDQYNNLCAQNGISSGQCSSWTGQRIIDNSKELAMIIVPTEIYEVVPVGKGFGILAKGSKKIIATVQDSKQAQRILDNIAASKAGNKAANFNAASQNKVEQLAQQSKERLNQVANLFGKNNSSGQIVINGKKVGVGVNPKEGAKTTIMCAEITGHFHLGDSRQPTCKSPLPFDLAF